jgi:6-phosphogluconolactonase
VSLRVFEDKEDLARAAAEDFVRRAEATVQETGRFTVALAGGSTPKAAYELLAREYGEYPFWRATHLFFGDERPVASDHADSNYRMAQEALLDHVPAGSVHRMRGELPPERAAEAYEAELREFFGGEPVFDLVLLGIGEDGHTASLFPGTAALEVRDRLVAANPVPKLETTRITLTVPVLNAARAVVFLVSGAGKAGALRAFLEGEPDPAEYPASLVRPAGGEPVWMVDQEAASLLEKS